MSVKQEQRLIEVVPYDSNWSIQFLQEAERIKKALSSNCIEIHHIGSTSVPDLAAKPVIDMIPVVLDITKVESANDSMRALGYETKGEYGIPFRRYFQKGGNQRTHQAHVFELGNPEIERHLKFRDWMRTHPEDRDAYARLKQDLARQHPNDITAYCLGKRTLLPQLIKNQGLMD
ncbi:GrpB family protein [Legionella pneumophila]|nr:GrpB family protein [Legionella pneumophila]